MSTELKGNIDAALRDKDVEQENIAKKSKKIYIYSLNIKKKFIKKKK